jgi:hypothetical protein
MEIEMRQLCEWLEKRCMTAGRDDHWTICQEAANKWALWDGDDKFPLWLSFVVQGYMREVGVA